MDLGIWDFRSGAGNPDKLAATRARKRKPQIGLERDVAAAAKLRARRAYGTVADLEALYFQRSSRLRVRDLAWRRRSGREPGGSAAGSMPLEQAVKQVGPEVGQSRGMVAQSVTLAPTRKWRNWQTRQT